MKLSLFDNIKGRANSLLTLLLWLFVGALLWQRIPGVIEHFQKENQPAPSFQVPLLNGDTFDLKTKTHPLVVVFWATWCGPCEVELSRINQMIEKGEVTRDSVVAIASHEDRALIEKVSRDRNYRFLVGVDETGSVAQAYGVRGTPTIVFIDASRKIHWITTGLSPFLGVRLSRFLKSQ